VSEKKSSKRFDKMMAELEKILNFVVPFINIVLWKDWSDKEGKEWGNLRIQNTRWKWIL